MLNDQIFMTGYMYSITRYITMSECTRKVSISDIYRILSNIKNNTIPVELREGPVLGQIRDCCCPGRNPGNPWVVAMDRASGDFRNLQSSKG